MTRLAILLSLITLLFLTSCQPQQINQLEQIKKQGYIKVYTRIAPTSMYVGEQGFTGFEYELVQQFADYLGVRVQIVTETDIAKIINGLAEGRGDLAAAGLTITKEREQQLRFGPPYQEIVSKLVYQQGNKRPRDLNQINGQLTVLANSSHSEALRKIKADYPELNWQEVADISSLELLDQVLDGSIDYTVIDSNELDLARQVLPEVAVAFNLSSPEQLGWAFAQSNDDSLFAKAIEFFSNIRQNGTLDFLLERYYGHLSKFDYVGSREFLRAVDSRLQEFIPYFKEAAKDDLDWRFLAAMGYQESHWKPDARSPTGVRGLMMLTQNTAKQLGIKDRLDPKQSILGGADYLRLVGKKIPERIPEPDRSWFALASYNVGFGHLEDARRLAEADGANPDKWQQVKKYLPLLRQKKWYSKTRFGYARGDEPVRYVNNIRQYYEVLKQLDHSQLSNLRLEQNQEQPSQAELLDNSAEKQSSSEQQPSKTTEEQKKEQ